MKKFINDPDDAVAVGEIFTSPRPLPVGGFFLWGNYAGEVMNFQLAADMAKAEGIEG